MSARRTLKSGSHTRGFTLVELMVAIVLGILISIGLVSVFGATSKANRVQDALAQMQENGRYAINRMSYDLRMESRQLMSASGFLPSAPGANGAVNPVLAPQVYVDTIKFPDGDLTKPPTWDTGKALSWWPLSPRYFIEGYECGSSCTVPVKVAPSDASIADGQRVKKSDVLVVRYLNTHGWSSYNGEVTTTCAGPNLTSITVTPVTAAPVNSPAFNFATNDLAMLTYSNGASYIFQVSVAGNVLTPSNILNGGTIGGCSSSGSGPEATVFNFSNNFVTATYWLQLVTDANTANRFIPSLFRREATIKNPTPVAAELIQGAEQLDFNYGVQAADGSTRYLKADDVEASTLVACPLPPQQYTQYMPNTMEATGCLWRAVKTIEVHLLVDSVNNMYDLTPPEMAFLYNPNYGTSYTYTGTGAPPANPSGLPFDKLMRREFVSLVSVRNFNP